jgi:hypothetical protein
METDFEFWCAPMTMAEREQAMKGAKDDTNLLLFVYLFVKQCLKMAAECLQAGQIDELKMMLVQKIWIV